MDNNLTSRICFVANQAKQNEYEDVSEWMQRHLSADIRASRTRKPRPRGVKARLAKANGALAVLDQKRVREMSDSRFARDHSDDWQ